MRLLTQLRDLITDPSARITDILRRAKVLAVTLKQEEFKAWVTHELNGYPSEADLPPYRRFNSPPQGTFSGPFGSQVSNYQLPIYPMPDVLQQMASELRLPHPIAQIETLAKAGEDTLRFPWPTEAAILLRDKIQLTGGFVLVEVYQPITKAQLEGILDAVRNRLLDFLLAIQELRPEVVESDDALQTIPPERISQAFHFNVYGGQPVIAAGHGVSQQVIQVTPGNLPELIKMLRGVGIDQPDLQELESAIRDDGKRPRGSLGDRVKAWMAKMMTKAIEGTWNVATGAAAEVLKKAILSYYGWQ
ncbi:MAG: hypothetical protein ACRDIC_01495 [bacterium]